jgi:hypothetical protein
MDSALQKAEDFFADVKEITDILGMFGDICDPEKLLEGLLKTLSDLAKDVVKTVSEFWSSLGDSNISSMLLTIASVLGLYLGSLLVTLVMDGLEELMAIMNSLMLSLLALVAGIEFVLQYFMVKFLRTLLTERYDLLMSLSKDVEFIRYFLSILDAPKVDNNAEDGRNLIEAKKMLDELILSLITEFVRSTEEVEGGKYSQTKPIDVGVLRDTDLKIKLIQEKLTKGFSKLALDDIKYIAEAADLDVSTLLKENPYRIFDKVAKGLKDKYVPTSLTNGNNLSSDERRALIRQQLGLINMHLSKVNPNIASYIHILLGVNILGNYIKSVNEKIPILSSRSIKNSKGNAVGSLSTRNLIETIFTGNMEIADYAPEYIPYSGRTLKDLNTAINIAETAILLFPNLWDILKKITPSWQADMFKSGIDQLVDVSDKMGADIETNTIQPSKNFGYFTKLSSIQSMCFPSPSGVTISGKSSEYMLNLGLSLDTITRAAGYLKNLKITIVNKSLVKGQFVADTPADKVVSVSKKTLLPLIMLDMAVFLSNNMRRDVISGCSGINIAITRQIELDNLELMAANSYISGMDSITEFVFVKNAIEEFLNSEKTPLADSILNGDVSGIIRASNLVENMLSPVYIIACMFDDDGDIGVNPIDTVLNFAVASASSIVPTGVDDAAKAELRRVEDIKKNIGISKERLMSLADSMQAMEISMGQIRERINLDSLTQ